MPRTGENGIVGGAAHSMSVYVWEAAGGVMSRARQTGTEIIIVKIPPPPVCVCL